MSQENVELVRRGVAHLIETGEPLWELIDPQVEIEPDPFGPFGGRTYVGHEGLQNWAATSRRWQPRRGRSTT